MPEKTVTGAYVPNLDKARNDAYFILSDSGQIRKRKVNLHNLVCFHNASIEAMVFKDHATTGAVSRDNDDEMVLKVKESLSEIESSFEIATTLAMMVTHEAPTRLTRGRMFPHQPQENNEVWKHAQDVAMFVLFYDVTPKEFKALHHKNSQKLISKLAKKKGLPTRYILRRLSLEIGK